MTDRTRYGVGDYTYICAGRESGIRALVDTFLSITHDERDQWLACMAEALAQRAYPPAFINYLMEQLAKPAELIRATCEQAEVQHPRSDHVFGD